MEAAALGAWLVVAGPAVAQSRVLSEATCQALRLRIAGHAKLSEGVRRALASQAAAYPASPASTAPAPGGAGGRAGAIHARLQQISGELQRLEEQRVGALVKLDFRRAGEIQGQIQVLEQEKADLGQELAGVPAEPAAPATAPPTKRAGSDVNRIPCRDIAATYDTAVRIRQRELGAREGQAGVVPLVTLKGQTKGQIARELAAQFAAWPEAGTQVGLLDRDGDGRLDGFVDVPAQGVFRLYRRRPDGTVTIEVFTLQGRRPGPAYGDTTRRLDEMAAQRMGRTLGDLLTTRPAGPVRSLGETAEFDQVHAHFLAGNFKDAARVEGAAARSAEFENVRGETVRVLEIIAPAPGGVVVRRVSIVARPDNRELWEETATQVRPVSYWRTDVQVTVSRETRMRTGTRVGARSIGGPFTFSLER
ncbi:MAG: hypothetical protein ACE5IQ_08315 [Candidatus Methylomirabilales bacterium]